MAEEDGFVHLFSIMLLFFLSELSKSQIFVILFLDVSLINRALIMILCLVVSPVILFILIFILPLLYIF